MNQNVCEIPRCDDGVWRRAPASVALREGEVHVWRAELDIHDSRVKALSELLSTDERQRANRFHFEKDCKHFIVARAALRTILGHYLKTAPDKLRFCYNSFGKPGLADAHAGAALRFNASHSGGLALYGVTCGPEGGIDVERVRDDFDVHELAGRFFSQSEAATLRSVPTELQSLAFFNCWTRKEAYIKAQGKWLSLPLEQFEVSLAPDEPAALLSTAHDPKELARWRLQSLFPGVGYAGAIVVEGHQWRARCWQWSG